MGSVKDLETIKKPTRTEMGVGRFHFSDRYSVFDWGEMPDHIKGKGAALCLMGAYCFERLEEKGVHTHYRGLVNEKGKLVQFDELDQPTNIMEIRLVNAIKPKPIAERGKLEYNYSVYTPNLVNFQIPLETIYRNGLPEGSSIFKRLEQGQVTIEELGVDHYPRTGERLAKPIFDVSTKFEQKDRYITWKEAQKIAALTTDELEQLKQVLLNVDRIITQTAIKADLENEDGKIELAFDPKRKLMVVDVIGTLDECRFTYHGLHVSKEIARQYFRRIGWHKEVEEAKRKAEQQGIEDWRKLCKIPPPKLDPPLKQIISEMYMSAANELTERKMFEIETLAEIVKKYREYESSAG